MRTTAAKRLAQRNGSGCGKRRQQPGPHLPLPQPVLTPGRQRRRIPTATGQLRRLHHRKPSEKTNPVARHPFPFAAQRQFGAANRFGQHLCRNHSRRPPQRSPYPTEPAPQHLGRTGNRRRNRRLPPPLRQKQPGFRFRNPAAEPHCRTARCRPRHFQTTKLAKPCRIQQNRTPTALPHRQQSSEPAHPGMAGCGRQTDRRPRARQPETRTARQQPLRTIRCFSTASGTNRNIAAEPPGKEKQTLLSGEKNRSSRRRRNAATAAKPPFCRRFAVLCPHPRPSSQQPLRPSQ